jgi:phage tail P2-like protein
MADERLLPPGIRDERFRAFLALLERWDDIDLLPLLPNRVDTAPAALLYPLAWQFGVTGLAGWDLADTEAKRRELIRRAVELHRRRGTPWAIREAFRAVGFPDLRIEEYYGRARRNGVLRRNGQTYRSPGGAWADFALVVEEASDRRLITREVRDLLLAIARVWKPARSRLSDLRFTGYRHDARYRRDGTMLRSGI